MNVLKIVRAMKAEGIISSANSTKMDISTFLGFSCLVALPLDNHSDAFFALHVCERAFVFFTARTLVSCSGLTTFLPPFSYTDVMTLECKMEASNSGRQTCEAKQCWISIPPWLTAFFAMLLVGLSSKLRALLFIVSNDVHYSENCRSSCKFVSG